MALTYTHEARRVNQERDLATALAIAYSLIPEGHEEEDHLDAILNAIADEYGLDAEVVMRELGSCGIRSIE